MSGDVLSLQRQSALHDEWLLERLDTVLPTIMKRAGVDCWVLVAREYNEDPVVKTMLPATWITARRRTILVFTDFGADRVAMSRYPVGAAFPGAWAPSEQPDQWLALAEYLDAREPGQIAINVSDTFALADGLSSAEAAAFHNALPSHLRERLVNTDTLPIGWLETRSPAEKTIYPDICRRAHGILRTALSPQVVTPGTTTTTDVVWWLRERVRVQGYRTWFHPSVSLQRAGANESLDDAIICPGDLIHIDFGIEYLGLHTDQQQHAYVLRPDEDDAPEGLKQGLAAANQLQDIVMSHFAVGTTGNEMLARSLQQARAEGLDPTVYSHPIGLHGHGAGPTIGLWDQQSGVPGAGDYPLWPDTAYSIELNVTAPVREWNQAVCFMLEEDAFFDGERIAFLDGRQTEFWLI